MAIVLCLVLTTLTACLVFNIVLCQRERSGEEKQDTYYVPDVEPPRDKCDGSYSCRESFELGTTTRRTTTEPPSNLPKGPLFNFLNNMCDTLLTRFRPDELRLYLRVLRKGIGNLGVTCLMRKEVKHLRKKLKKMSLKNCKAIQKDITNFVAIINSGAPKMKEFFNIVNSIFTVYDDNRMDDYIFELKKFGVGRARGFEKRTRNFFAGFIFYKINKQDEELKKEIRSKFNLAYAEYNDE